MNYEVRVAAFIAVKMLAGDLCTVWDGISGADVIAVTLQAPESVDDVVVDLRPGTSAHAFISAKDRSGTIPLTGRSTAFVDTVVAFVAQFFKIPREARTESRFVWAIPSSAGRAATRELLGVLDTHRLDAGDTSLAKFLHSRRPIERNALRALILVAIKAWKRESGSPPSEDELRQFLRLIHVEVYDFEFGSRHDLLSEGDIRVHIAGESKAAHSIWGKIELFFSKADQRGLRVTPASLRQVLTAEGFTLKLPPDYATDITRLRELTKRNLTRLKKHTMLPFGPKPADAIHIERSQELSALLTAAKCGHLLITGEPGCGKSGLIHSLAGALQAEGSPVVLLLAEEVFGRDWKGTANLPGIEHAFDDVLAHWHDGARGFFIADALDAVRDVEMQKSLRRMLRDVQEGDSHWTVIASVREFDLKHGREMREAFSGDGVAGHASNDFASVAHFYLTGLTEAQLDELANQRSEIRPFVESARQSARSGGLHRSPFYLRLAAELLKDGVTPARLADWNSPAVLLRKFWEARIEEGDGANERGSMLTAVCRKMVDTRSMALSAKEISLNSTDRVALRELRSHGILQSPRLRHGTRVSDEEIRFTHHLLHDYAIARALIPTILERFCDFAIREPLLPIFYRQSFMFSLEELWDADEKREDFWVAALRLESVASLHGITRILAPILAARRVETFRDLQPLLAKVAGATNPDAPAPKALRHLASGLQDARADSILVGAAGWCEFAASLSDLLATAPFIEGPLVHILARINAVGVGGDHAQSSALNKAGRALLANHVAKPVGQGWRYDVNVAVETICRMFSVAPAKAESALLSMLTPERLTQLPHDDLFELAGNLKHLGDEGDTVVIRLFEAAFAAEPEIGQWQDFGSAILPMQIQSSDQWSMIHYELAEYYEAQTGHNVGRMTEAACIAWNATVWRCANRHEKTLPIVATVPFRGKSCELVEDHSHNWERSWEHEENRVLIHFENLLREWAAAGDIAQLGSALDRFAARNRTSLMWTVLMEAGAEYPVTLGALLGDVLDEPVFLTHPDYAYGATCLLGALHKVGNPAARQRLEALIRNLPKNVRLRRKEPRKPTPSWVEYAQNRLLGVLEEPNIVLQPVLQSIDWLWETKPDEVRARLHKIAIRAAAEAPAENHIHETLAHTHLFQCLRTGRGDCELYISDLVADCDSQRVSKALLPQLHTCRDGGWLTAGDGSKADAEADAVRGRTWSFFSKLLATAQAKLNEHREEWRQLHEHGQPDATQVKPVQEKLDRAVHLVDGIAMQLYFASGAHAEKQNKDERKLTAIQTQRFWQEAAPLFSKLAEEPHPHTAYHGVQTLYHLLPYAPREVFLLAAKSICSSAAAGFQYESLAISEVVKLIQRALADHRDIFQSEKGQESECLVALLQVLDLFVEAGWAEARQLTHRLEEIYR